MKSLKISASLSRRISQFNNNVTFFHKQLELVILLSNLFFSQSDSRIFRKFEFLFHENGQYTGVWTFCSVYKLLHLKIDYTLRCLEYICSVSSH